MHAEPLWETTARPPSRMPSGMPELYRDTRSRTLTSPRQFGPHSTIPVRAQMACSSRCRARPSSPNSANPLANTTAARRPCAAPSSRVETILSAGTASTAHSAGSGSSENARYAGSPATSGALGCTGKMRPA